MALSARKRYSRFPLRTDAVVQALTAENVVDAEDDQEVVELTVGYDVGRVGFALWTPPVQQAGALVVKQVNPDTWAFNAGVEVGSELLELNGSDVAGIGQQELKVLMQDRPLHLKLRRPTTEEWRRVDYFQKDNIRLALRVTNLQQALQAEHHRAVQLQEDEAAGAELAAFQWWTASRTRLQDELFQAESQLHLALGANRSAVEIAEMHFRRQEAKLERKGQEAASEQAARMAQLEQEQDRDFEAMEADLDQLERSNSELEEELADAQAELEEARSEARVLGENGSKGVAGAAGARGDQLTQVRRSLQQAQEECQELSEDRAQALARMRDAYRSQGALAVEERERRSQLAFAQEDMESTVAGLEQELAEAAGSQAQVSSELAAAEAELSGALRDLEAARRGLDERVREASASEATFKEELALAQSQLRLADQSRELLDEATAAILELKEELLLADARFASAQQGAHERSEEAAQARRELEERLLAAAGECRAARAEAESGARRSDEAASLRAGLQEEFLAAEEQLQRAHAEERRGMQEAGEDRLSKAAGSEREMEEELTSSQAKLQSEASALQAVRGELSAAAAESAAASAEALALRAGELDAREASEDQLRRDAALESKLHEELSAVEAEVQALRAGAESAAREAREEHLAALASGLREAGEEHLGREAALESRLREEALAGEAQLRAEHADTERAVQCAAEQQVREAAVAEERLSECLRSAEEQRLLREELLQELHDAKAGLRSEAAASQMELEEQLSQAAASSSRLGEELRAARAGLQSEAAGARRELEEEVASTEARLQSRAATSQRELEEQLSSAFQTKLQEELASAEARCRSQEAAARSTLREELLEARAEFQTEHAQLERRVQQAEEEETWQSKTLSKLQEALCSTELSNQAAASQAVAEQASLEASVQQHTKARSALEEQLGKAETELRRVQADAQSSGERLCEAVASQSTLRERWLAAEAALSQAGEREKAVARHEVRAQRAEEELLSAERKLCFANWAGGLASRRLAPQGGGDPASELPGQVFEF